VAHACLYRLLCLYKWTTNSTISIQWDERNVLCGFEWNVDRHKYDVKSRQREKKVEIEKKQDKSFDDKSYAIIVDAILKTNTVRFLYRRPEASPIEIRILIHDAVKINTR
jgi:hypothetical protein